eukprot:TRINITY_DN6675_c0_g5_i1.p1 TRINITY_DN6675_c0_g5~~TRINITY_DN6675_c0_g5_i1.p1  ORF type:complete len:185 (-),score=24.66 TRINITY_DN6675_c0_g5_i1:179-691(-)
MALYGWALHYGLAIPRDMTRSMKLLQQSKHITARVSFLTFVGELTEAYQLLSTECDTSDAHVQFLLGQCLWKSWGNRTEAVQCFLRAGNHLFAICCLSEAHLYGFYGVEKSFGSAFKLLEQAADQGWADAQCEIGVLNRVSDCKGCVLSFVHAWQMHDRHMQKAFYGDES